MSWRYLIDVLENFEQFPGDICSVSCRYMMDVMEIYDGCVGDI